MQGESKQPGIEADAVDLALLADRLVLQGMPIQRVIGEEAGVSQSTVSRAVHRKILGQSPGAERLWRYAEERARVLREEVVEAVGERSLAVAPGRGGPTRRTPRRPRLKRETDSVPVGISEEEREALAQRAMVGLEEYLADRFDPQLVIEQLAVLRRAQDHGRSAKA